MIDFSFVYDELKDKYSSTMGRKAEDVIRMFKYLLLKNYYKLSDRGLVERTKTDMLFKYFLDYLPEEINLIDPSLLTVFRRERLSNKDNEEETATNLMDKLISKTVEIALAEGIIEIKNKIIQDSTHFTKGGVNKTDTEYEIEYSKDKDAKMYVCRAGHMAIKKRHSIIKDTRYNSQSEVESYFFDIGKCKYCPYKEGCYKEGAKSKTYNVTIKNDVHIKHMDYMKTEEFQKLYSERYKIEAKNSELKSNFGYDKANSCGKNGITIQGARALFLANIKRIIKLKEEKIQNNG